jgi:hypothetical protein
MRFLNFQNVDILNIQIINSNYIKLIIKTSTL